MVEIDLDACAERSATIYDCQLKENIIFSSVCQFATEVKHIPTVMTAVNSEKEKKVL